MEGVVNEKNPLFSDDELGRIREQLDNTHEEILNLINDYIKNNCVEFKKKEMEKNFTDKINNSISNIRKKLDNNHIVLNDSNYSNISNSMNSNSINITNYSNSNASISLNNE